MLRDAVRSLADDKIAPRAAEIDETAEFPFDVYEALKASDLHAVHVPEEYGGAGADALAVCIVIEEVARACASSSLLAAGEGMFSYGLSEPEAGSDVRGIRTKAVRDGDEWVLNGTKRWISNAGVSEYYTVV